MYGELLFHLWYCLRGTSATFVIRHPRYQALMSAFTVTWSLVETNRWRKQEVNIPVFNFYLWIHQWPVYKNLKGKNPPDRNASNLNGEFKWNTGTCSNQVDNVRCDGYLQKNIYIYAVLMTGKHACTVGLNRICIACK